MGRVIEAFAQFFTGDGSPLSNGWLGFFESNSNNTKKDTFADSVLQVPNSNPLMLDAEGRCPNVFGTGDYRVVSYENDPEDFYSPGAMVQMFDPVSAQGSVSGGGSGGGFDIWDGTVTYGLGDIVTYNTRYYRSTVVSNLGLNPAIETGSWEEFEVTAVWNNAVSYAIHDIVHYGTNLYISLASPNLNNIPGASPTLWRPIASGIHLVEYQTTDYEILPVDRDNLIILSSVTTADSQFDLPAMDATTDTFTVWVYNDSDYILTMTALGTSVIWIDTSGEITIPKGVVVKFTYVYAADTWTVTGNVATVLGGQDLGTPNLPIINLYSTYLRETTVIDDESLFFGTDADTSITFLSATNVLKVVEWEFSTTGLLAPSASNPNPHISLPNNGQLRLGNSNELVVVHQLAAGYIGTTTSEPLYLMVNSVVSLTIDPANDVYINNDLYGSGLISVDAGGSFYLNFQTTQSVLYSGVGDLLLVTSTGTAMNIAANRTVTCYTDLLVGDSLTVTNDIYCTDLISSGLIEFTNLSDGTTALSATIAEINSHCDGVPYTQAGIANGPITVTTTDTTVATLSLGTVNAGSFIFITATVGQIEKLTTTGVGYARLSAAGGATVYLGSTYSGTAPTGYSPSITAGSTISNIFVSCMLYVASTGTVTLTLSGAVSSGSAYYTNNSIMATWLIEA